MDKVTVEMDFRADGLERRMGVLAAHLALSLDHKHMCSNSCKHGSTLHIKVTDTKTSKVSNFYFGQTYAVARSDQAYAVALERE